MTILHLVWLAEGILKRFHITRIQTLATHDAAKATLERAGLQVNGVMQVIQNIDQLHESIAQSDLPRGPQRRPSDKYYTTLLIHALWEGFHMNVMLKSFTGQYVSPTFGGEWSISRTTLQYAPLVVLPLKKTIIDGCPFLQWITPLPVEWLVERDWWIQTHWEDNDCRMVYRNLVACPILRDMLSTARLYPGGRIKIIELKAIPPPREEPPKAVTIDNCAVMLMRYLLTARELELIYDLVSSDYLVSAYVYGSYASNNVVKNEVNMQVLKWTVTSHKSKSKKAYKLNTIDKPSVQALSAYAFIPREDYHQDAWLRSGREVQLRPNVDDLALARTLGSVEETALEETNMFQTDARDLAADREAEEHEDNFDCYGEKEVSSMDNIFKENEKLTRCREGHQTYGYCAWCDAPIGNPNKLWKHYSDVHQVLMQVAPMSPPSVWQTLMGREMGARTPQFQVPQGQYKYWVQPAQRDGIDSFVIGSSKRGKETLVSLGELLLAGNGTLPLVATCPATSTLSPRQKPPNCVRVFPDGTDYWSKVKLYDANTLLSIGTPITSDMAFLTMFSEWGNILGGKQDGRGEYSSQEMYGIRRYPDTLRMMSQEVEDVMKSRVAPLDVLRLRVPHCSMPAPEADQARITPAYHEDKGEAREFLRCALAARKRYGYFDCSTCPERLIFDHLWIDDSEYVADSKVLSNPFANQWSFADSTELEKWSQMLHVDVWGIAQEIQRKGVESEFILLDIAKRDSGRRVWPVSLVRHPAPNQASSSAVGMALDRYPWVDSGLRWKGTMVYKESPGEDRSTLFESARKPGVNPLSGPASSSQDALSSPAPPAKAMPDALSKADSSTGKAASSGRPASEPDVKDKGQGTSVPKSSAPARATSDSGISAPTKEQDKPVGPIASSTAVSQSTPSPKPASTVASTTAAMDSVPKAKAPSGAASMPAPAVGSTGGSERGVQSASRAPSGAASQTSVTAGSGYPTIAESLEQKRVPPLKAAPSSKGTGAPSSKPEGTGPAAAKGSTTAEPAAVKGSTTTPSEVKEEVTSQDTAQPARAPRAPDVQAPVEKDAAMTYTELVMKQAASAVPTSQLTDEEYERLAQERWQKLLDESAKSVSGRATSVAHLPKELRGEMLPPQPLFSPIRGWIDGLTPPVHKEGRTIELSLPGVAGIFKWTLLAESKQQKRPARKRVERSSSDQLGMDGLIMITDRSTGDRIPWNTGVKQALEKGMYAWSFERENAQPEDKKIILHMQPISYLSDANKIAWIRAFLGWAYKASMIQEVDPQVEMSVHSGLVHFLTEMYSRVSVKGAKPLSEIGQGIPVYAGGQEIRTGKEGLMTSDWGNHLFIAAGRKVVDSLFTGASSKKDSDLGDRMESAFNLSFWEKEGAFDWSWLGLDLVNERMTDELLASLEWSCYRESEELMIQTFLSISWPCAAAALRLLQMCDLCDNGILQMPSTCPWCSSPVTVRGYSLYMQLENYTTHLKDHASCVGMYTSIVDKYGSVQGQAVPTVKGLLSDADLRRANEYSSDYVTIYISVNGHRQWPSMGQPLINFISTLIGNARVAFIQEMIALRKTQAHAQANNLDIPKKDWTAPVKWYKGTTHPRAGPPKERLDSLLSTTPIFKAAMAGGAAEAKALWPEVEPGTNWSTPSEVAEWEGKWRNANEKPLELWKSQGTGIGLPMIIPLRENPRGDKALLDQLVNTGTRSVKGVAAVNGLAFRKMRVGSGIKAQISGFEAAATEFEPAMKAVREYHIDPHIEMRDGKLKDTFSVFKKRVGPKKDEESETTLEEEESEEEEPKARDDDVDFDVSDEDIEFEEDEEDEDDVQPEEPPEPEWPDILNGPLTAQGRFNVEPYTGPPRFPHAAVWPVRKPEKEILAHGMGIRAVYQHKHGHFTLVTRVVAANPGGHPKVIICYAQEALSKEQRQEPEPWKIEEIRNFMRLSRLRVGLRADQLLMFGFANPSDDIPAVPDANLYYPQYVPTRAKATTSSFTVVWIRKVTKLRSVPSRIRADPPPLSTGLLWNTKEEDLIDPYRVATELFGTQKVPEFDSPVWLRECSARGRRCSLCPDVEATRLLPCCACENWIHLECSYGVPEGRLCAAHCQIIDPLKGVVVTDFNCPKGEVRCLVPWRPWAKKYKWQWEAQRGQGRWGHDRQFFEMIPNWALEKHAWLGAGLIWKRVHASSPVDRIQTEAPDRMRRPRVVPTREEKIASGPLPPWKALPLVLPWDKSYRDTYHVDFDPSMAHHDLSWRCPMTSLAYEDYSNPDVMHGEVSPDRPWMLSPPEIPLAGATRRDPEDTRVMVYHGITYSHSGLTDPAVMPGYVAITKWRHEQTMKWTDLNPQLPEWSQVARYFTENNWDLGKEMQAFARPTGTERTMVYKADTRMWVPRPREPQPAPKKKGKAKAKAKTKPTRPEKEEKEPSTKRRKRRSVVKDENREIVNVKKEPSESDAEEEEGQEDKASESKADEQGPRVADTSKEKTKGVVLRRAADPEVKEKADALLGEKAPHSPVDRKSEEESAPGVDEDPYAKAPHGESDDEEDLEAELRSLGGLPPPRRSSEMRSDRSDRAAFDEEERRSVPSSSAVRPEKPRKKKKAEKSHDAQSAFSEEPAKRKKKVWQGSKKLAKRGHRSSPSRDPDRGTYELDMSGVPRDKLELTVSTLHRVNQGLKSSSDKAESALSGMTRAVDRMTKARNDKEGWLMEENRLLRNLIGWKKIEPREAPSPRSPSAEATESLEEDDPEELGAAKEEVGDA